MARWKGVAGKAKSSHWLIRPRAMMTLQIVAHENSVGHPLVIGTGYLIIGDFPGVCEPMFVAPVQTPKDPEYIPEPPSEGKRPESVCK